MKVIEKRSSTGTSLLVVIPKDIVCKVGLQKGDSVIVTVNDQNEIIINKLK